jgi:cation diffusion facilitator CzcD-associated flavoprotein CzcO
MNPKRVCIVGAGVSGLVTAKVMLSQGHDVTIYEKVSTLGGVWSWTRRYPGLQLQTIRDCYAFSDFPMPAHYPEFPSGPDLYNYLIAYATHFGILPYLRLNHEVVATEPRADRERGWRIAVRDDAGNIAANNFDFVVVCNGIYSEPSVPRFPGCDEFQANGGLVLHSSQVGDAALLRDRDVVVVGFGKSALDLAEASLATARSTGMVCRRIPWKVPHRIWGRIHIKYLLLSRFTELWFRSPTADWFHRLLHSWLHPLVRLYWAVAEHIIAGQLGMTKAPLRPQGPLRVAATCVTLTLDNLKLIRDGRIVLHRGGIVRFAKDGLVLDTGETMPAQVVVLATGFRLDFPFLGAGQRARLFDDSGAMQLYRLLINPDIADMAFNGFNGVGSCQLTAEVGAAWLARFIEGRVAVPDRETMWQSIRDEIALRRELLSTSHGVGFYATPATMAYLDRLLADLGLPPADSHRRLFDWLFTPLDPRDYRNLLAPSEAANR